jgi:hypothetical protein
MITAIIVLVVGSIWVRGFWFTEIYHTQKSNEPNRRALLAIRDAINVGASHADVLTAYWQHRTPELKLSAEQPSIWSVGIPLEFGASDWGLRIEFANGKVSALRVRTSDGSPPKDGPKDK